jgi:hypothetical protein
MRKVFDGTEEHKVWPLLDMHPHHNNVPLAELLLENWTRVRASLGENFAQWVIRDEYNFWGQVAPFLDDYPAAAQEALSHLETRRRFPASASILDFIVRARPRSALLRDYCLSSIEGYQSQSLFGEQIYPDAIVAAEILGNHFRGDEGVLQSLLAMCPDDTLSEEVWIALQTGWYDDPRVEQIREKQRGLDRRISLVTAFALSRFDAEYKEKATQFLVDDFLNLLAQLEKAPWLCHPSLARVVTQHFQSNERFGNMLLERLNSTPSASEKATIPRIIAAGKGVSAELRAWCISEISAQLSGTRSPEIGFDITSREFRPVVHCLLDITG